MKTCDIKLKGGWLELIPKEVNGIGLSYWLTNPHCRERRLVFSFYLNNQIKSRWTKGVRQILKREQDDLISISFNPKDDIMSVYYVESSGWTFAFKARMKEIK